ncbi:MAG: flagellar biosynthetic protein FliR [Nevskia sp.]|jgi:flagellar biosynthetic protein FliR|nr:flagellar biosynthetic protein FliR [Nevskia sp.]MCK9384108.1 flagellar biosynthetic protein FliR [Nevskia sp.]
MSFTDAQLLGWIEAWLWPLIRIGGILSIAPVLGSTSIPVRIRVVLAVLLTLALAPVLPTLPSIPLFSATWWLETARQLLIGVAMGFVLTLVFEAAVMAGELIAYGMGLSFAQVLDPLHGSTTPVIGQILTISATLLFLASNGHLRLIEALAASFQGLPVGVSGLNGQVIHGLVAWGGNIFSGGLQIALPVVIALLLVNLAFGVMSRSAPAISAISVGFPLALIVGIVLLRFSLPVLNSVLMALLDSTFELIEQVFGGNGG